MERLRSLIRRRRGFAAVLLLVALLVRILVPAGYMPLAGESVLTICTGTGMQTIAMPETMTDGHAKHLPGGHDAAARSICAFAALGLSSTGAIDPPLLLALLRLAFVAALAALVGQQVGRAAFLRPPLRAPPPLS